MRPYIELKRESEDDSQYKKLRVLFGSGSYPYSTEQGRIMNRTTTGKLSYQIGPKYKYWYGEIRVKTNEEVGFATLDDIESWMSSSSPADHKLVMRPWGWVGSYTTSIAMPANIVHLASAPPSGFDLAAGQYVSVAGYTGAAEQIVSLLGPQDGDLGIAWPGSTSPMFNYYVAASGSHPTPAYVWNYINATITMQQDFGCYKVVFVTGSDPQPQVPYAIGQDAFQRIPFRLEQRQ